jgi:hypothetical protein
MMRSPFLDDRAALRLMFRGSELVLTNGKRAEHSVIPGGPVSNATAKFIIEHTLCYSADAGLLTRHAAILEISPTITMASSFAGLPRSPPDINPTRERTEKCQTPTLQSERTEKWQTLKLQNVQI